MEWFNRLKRKATFAFKKAKVATVWGVGMLGNMLKHQFDNRDISIQKDMSQEDVLLAIEAKQDEIRDALNKLKEFRASKLIELEEELQAVDVKLKGFNQINREQLEVIGTSVKASIMSLMRDRNSVIDRMTQIKRKSKKELELEAYSLKLDSDYEKIRQNLNY